MEVDEIQTTKFQRICFNNNSNSHNDTSSNPKKLATNGVNNDIIVGWPLSRIVRVSRSSGGKDRHSKVITSKGLRDRRVRLSVTTAIQFYDLQDRLGYDQPSKAVEWLIKAAADSIDQLPSLDPCFNNNITNNNNNNNDNDKVSFSISKSSACSSTSETSKGSGLSLSRSENRVRARERARELAAKKEKVKGVSQNSSFTDLLTGGLNSTTVSPDNNNKNNNNNNSSHDTSPESTNQLNYFQMPLFDGDNNCNVEVQQRQYHNYSFVHQENNMNFVPGLGLGLSRGTLQSNLVSILPHNYNQVQRFQQPMVDGCTASTNFPFVMGPTMGAHHQFQANGYDSQRLQLYGGGRDFDHHKERLKN